MCLLIWLAPRECPTWRNSQLRRMRTALGVSRVLNLEIQGTTKHHVGSVRKMQDLQNKYLLRIRASRVTITSFVMNQPSACFSRPERNLSSSGMNSFDNPRCPSCPRELPNVAIGNEHGDNPGEKARLGIHGWGSAPFAPPENSRSVQSSFCLGHRRSSDEEGDGPGVTTMKPQLM